jgi:hypothetical protein
MNLPISIEDPETDRLARALAIPYGFGAGGRFEG